MFFIAGEIHGGGAWFTTWTGDCHAFIKLKEANESVLKKPVVDCVVSVSFIPLLGSEEAERKKAVNWKIKLLLS